jgi:hypothetical protein
VEWIGVFTDWVNSWSRRAVLKRAIQMIMPVPEHADNTATITLKSSATSGEDDSPFCRNPITRSIRAFCLRHVDTGRTIRRCMCGSPEMFAARCDHGSGFGGEASVKRGCSSWNGLAVLTDKFGARKVSVQPARIRLWRCPRPGLRLFSESKKRVPAKALQWS